MNEPMSWRRTVADPTLGLVTVAFFSSDVAEGLLRSVSAASREQIPVVVVDNSPEDDGIGDIVSAHPEAKLVVARHNPGYGAAMNIGVSQLPPSVKWLVLANPDLIIQPGAIDTLLAATVRWPYAAAFGPLIRNSDGTVYPSARKLPSLRTGIGHAMFVRVWSGNPWTGSYRNDLAAIDEHAVGWLSGSFLLVKRSVFEAIRGFDERYFMYFEDVDLGRNLKLSGWESVYVPSAEVVHFGAQSTNRVARAMIRAHHESAYKYLAKRYRHWYLWPIRVTLRVGLSVRGRMSRG
jgi:N-acetylglucosaminyl-diphospho-decaprenol L-rhamnosyltransferase